jgi:hypothetical protein
MPEGENDVNGTAAAAEVKPQQVQERPALVAAPEKPKSRPGPKVKKPAEERLRYFLAKSGSSADVPELGAEVESESEELIQSFRLNGAPFYTVAAYCAEIEINGGSPMLVKRPAKK